jgi:hypothetical protein
MSKSAKPLPALGFNLLNWFVVLCAPEPGKELFVGEYTRDDKLRWVRDPAGRPWLAIDTSRAEARLLEEMGLLDEQRLEPALIVMSAKSCTMRCFPRYRLTLLGLRFCRTILELPDNDLNHKLLRAVIDEGFTRPRDVPEIIDEIRDHGALAGSYLTSLVGIGRTVIEGLPNKPTLRDERGELTDEEVDELVEWAALLLVGKGEVSMYRAKDRTPNIRAECFAAALKGLPSGRFA